jgi:hypothetical protein
MSPPIQAVLNDHRFRDSVSVIAAVAVIIVVTGVLGYGNFLATVPGFVVVVVAAYVGLHVGRAIIQ